MILINFFMFDCFTHWVSPLRGEVYGFLCALPETELWKGLKSIGMVERECPIGNEVTLGQRYFINSFAAGARLFAHAVRNHWGIENK